MRMQDDPKRFNFDLTCPKCRHLVRALIEAGPVYKFSDSTEQYAFLICRCPRTYCDLIFVKYDRLNSRVTHVFPYPRISASDYHESIPEPIRESFAEAQRCYFSDANKGVVAMCRRTMQGLAEDKGATGGNLKGEIDDLLSKGLITKSLHDAAHEIRYFGNFGAHPRDDGLDNISNEDVRQILQLTEDFLVDINIRPYQTAELTKKRKEIP
jgi:Domain of unknown function (DUF4145)